MTIYEVIDLEERKVYLFLNECYAIRLVENNKDLFLREVQTVDSYVICGDSMPEGEGERFAA